MGIYTKMPVIRSNWFLRLCALSASASAVGLFVLLGAGVAPGTVDGEAAAHLSKAHVLAGGNPRLATATLDVVSGTTSVVVADAAPAGHLYRVHTPAGSGIRPLATLDHRTLRVGQTADGNGNAVPTIDIELARRVRWTINLDGGATTETVNMARGSLSSLTFGAGVSMASVSLPIPRGTLTLTLAGGATRLLVVAPSGAPAEVNVMGGASEVDLDGTSHSGVAGGSVFTEPTWAGTANRYAIDLLTGVADFEMSRT
jgi:hypothetical protein